MRHALVLTTVLLVSPVFGQDAPLPAVTARTQAPVLVALAVEPVHEVPAVSLEDAARANDYATFHQLFEQTQSPAYAPLHELWTYSINDPIGAFYGPEMYARFAALYPEFEAYIDEYRIVDDHGNVLYPTSETRAFLLARAIEGRTVIAPQEPIRVAAGRRNRTRTSPDTTTTPAPAIRRVRLKKAEVTTPPETIAPKPEVRPAPVMVARSAPAPVVPAPAPARVPTPQPIMAASVIPVIEQTPVQNDDLTARGILLVIIGLVGIGLLTLILRTPSSSSDLGNAPH